MITGGCRCGRISYVCKAKPSYVGNCHCMDCQKFSGAPYVNWATFQRDQFVVEEGKIKAASCTPGVTRGFCGDCGTPIYWTSTENPEWIDITVGSIDNPIPFRPQGEAFVTRALPWVALDPAIPHHERGPFDDAP